MRQVFVLAQRALREAYARGTAVQQARAWKLFPAHATPAARAWTDARVTCSPNDGTACWTSARSSRRGPCKRRRCCCRRRGCLHTASGTRMHNRADCRGLPCLRCPDRSSHRAWARRPPERLQEVLADLVSSLIHAAVLTDAAVAQALRTARRGTAARLSGATCEHYKILLDDAVAVELFAHAANLLAAAHPCRRRCRSGPLPPHCAPQTGLAASAAFPLATPSSASCHAVSRECSPGRSTGQPGHTSLLCSPFLGPTRSPECSVPLSTSTLRQP